VYVSICWRDRISREELGIDVRMDRNSVFQTSIIACVFRVTVYAQIDVGNAFILSDLTHLLSRRHLFHFGIATLL
jgi:hypothetical protein